MNNQLHKKTSKPLSLIISVLVIMVTVFGAVTTTSAATDTATVSFEGNGATSNTFKTQVYTFGKTGQMFVGSIAKKGYSFAGWTKTPDGSGKAYKMNGAVIDSWIGNVATNYGGKITLYAQWKPATATVTFDGNGATSNTFGTQTYTYGKTGQNFVGSIAKKGYSFAGWTKTSDGTGKAYKMNGAVIDSWIGNVASNNNGKITLYAQWTPVTATVTFDGNGAASNTFGTQTYTYGESGQYFRGTIERPGYIFLGWSFSSEGPARYKLNGGVIDNWIKDVAAKYSGSVTLYAIWSEHEHSYTSSVEKEATCAEAGVTRYECECGDSYTEEIPATGDHSYESTDYKEPT
ncbi:MAG: InlB B-repeat-containing protein, partial [Parasporobacterium sp.]|nr:InlB B-repeat-containing protein [Parasporobacterium sp.]